MQTNQLRNKILRSVSVLQRPGEGKGLIYLELFRVSRCWDQCTGEMYAKMCKLVLLVGGRISKDKKLMQCKLNKLGFDMSKRYYTYSFLYYCWMALSVVYLCFVTTFFFFLMLFCCFHLFSFSGHPMWKLKSPLCPLLTKLKKLSTEVTDVTKITISLGEFSTVKSELTGNCSAPMVSH